MTPNKNYYQVSFLIVHSPLVIGDL
jgi:hypothetical protein